MVDRLLELKKGAADLRPDDIVVSIRPDATTGIWQDMIVPVLRRSLSSNLPLASYNSALKRLMAVEPSCKNFLMMSKW